MYSVVEFIEEDGNISVEAVPQLWIKQFESGKIGCYWPNHLENPQISKAIAKNSKPTLEWDIFEVKRVMCTTETLVTARQKAKEAEENTDIEEGENKKRKARSAPNPRYHDTSDDEPPARPSKMSKRTQSSQSVPPPRVPPALAAKSGTRRPSVVASNDTTNSQVQSKTPDRTTPRNLGLAGDLPQHQSNTPDQTTPRSHGLAGSRSHRSSEFEQRVMTTLETMKLQLANQSQQMRSIEDLLSKEYVADVPDNVDLPVRDMEDLKQLEEQLKNKETAKHLTTYLASIGGKTLAKATYNTLSEIMAKAVAIKYSLCGKQKKESFEELRLYKVVLRALLKAKDGSTKTQIRESIGVWLAQAADREGGRQNRRPPSGESGLGVAALADHDSNEC